MLLSCLVSVSVPSVRCSFSVFFCQSSVVIQYNRTSPVAFSSFSLSSFDKRMAVTADNGIVLDNSLFRLYFDVKSIRMEISFYSSCILVIFISVL